MGKRSKPEAWEIITVPANIYRAMLTLEWEAGQAGEAYAVHLAECRYYELVGRAHEVNAGFFEDAADMKAVWQALEAKRHGYTIRKQAVRRIWKGKKKKDLKASGKR
jgi:hypothetical protein